MSAEVRSIHLPGSAAVDALCQRAQAALDAWAREWVDGRISHAQPKVRVCTVAECPAPPAGHYEAVRTKAGSMWFRRDTADNLRFAHAVVGAELMPRSTCADDWIAGVVDCARGARNRALCTALLGTPPIDDQPAVTVAMPAHVFAFGSGAVLLSCEELALYAIADSAVWRAVPRRGSDAVHGLPKVTPLERAMPRAAARLEVVLGSVEVELPSILELRSGDVLRLPQRLDQGIAVLCEGNPLARAALGEVRGRKAVQILAGP